MKVKLLFTLSILALSCSALAQPLKYAGNPHPMPDNPDGYYVKFAAPELFVFKIFDKNGDGSTYFEIKKTDKSVGKIDASVNAMGGSTDKFYAYYGDLDNNKSNELVIVDYDSQSNGLGVRYFTINIFPDFQTKGFTKPLTFTDHEFGANGTFIYDARKHETLILLTEFRDSSKIDSKRKEGLYLVGKYFRYRQGLLEPAADKPVLYRRYLFAFEKERWNTIDDPRTPNLWFTSPMVRKLKAEPEEHVFIKSESGAVQKFEKISVKNPNSGEIIEYPQITVKFDSGESKTIALADRDMLPDAVNSSEIILPEAFGFLSKVTLPSYLRPDSVVKDFEGQRVRLDIYLSDPDGPSCQYCRLFFTGRR